MTMSSVPFSSYSPCTLCQTVPWNWSVYFLTFFFFFVEWTYLIWNIFYQHNSKSKDRISLKISIFRYWSVSVPKVSWEWCWGLDFRIFKIIDFHIGNSSLVKSTQVLGVWKENPRIRASLRPIQGDCHLCWWDDSSQQDGSHCSAWCFFWLCIYFFN